jgi:single-strand DNA-binding protein
MVGGLFQVEAGQHQDLRGRESAMYETQVTMVGRLATDIGHTRLGNGTAVANFRIGSTERRFDRATGGWVDGDELFVDVKCWRKLADNALASLVKGDPVVVTGRLYNRSYEHEGQRRTAVTLEAQNVAADLARCTVVLKRDRRASGEAGGAGDQEPDLSGGVEGAGALVGAVPAADG